MENITNEGILKGLIDLKRKEKAAVDRKEPKEAYRANWVALAVDKGYDVADTYLWQGFVYIGMAGFKDYFDIQPDKKSFLNSFYLHGYKTVKDESRLKAGCHLLALLFKDKIRYNEIEKIVLQELCNVIKNANDKMCKSAFKMHILEELPSDSEIPTLRDIGLNNEEVVVVISSINKCLKLIEENKLKGRARENYYKFRKWINEWCSENVKDEKSLNRSLEFNNALHRNDDTNDQENSTISLKEDEFSINIENLKKNIDVLKKEKDELEHKIRKLEVERIKNDQIIKELKKSNNELLNVKNDREAIIREKIIELNNLIEENKLLRENVATLNESKYDNNKAIEILEVEKDRALNVFKTKLLKTIQVEKTEISNMHGMDFDSETGEVLILTIEDLLKRLQKMCEK